GAFVSWVMIEVVAAGGATNGTVLAKKASIRSWRVARLALGVMIGVPAAIARVATASAAARRATVSATIAGAASAARVAAPADRAARVLAAGCRRRSSAPARAR